MTELNHNLSVLTLNTNGRSSSIQRHRLTEWTNKEDSTIPSLQETHLINKDAKKLKVEDEKRYFKPIGSKKRAGIAVLISDDIEFTVRDTKRDKNAHYIIIKGVIYQEEIMIINIDTPNRRAASYRKQLFNDIKGDIDENIIIL